MRTIIPGQELDSRSAADEALLGKVTWKLLPFLGLLYLISYIDRQNVNFAKLQMVADLRMSEAAYGLGAGLFFIGYFLFEIPSNLILVKVGARRWFARIMLTWGLVTILLAFTQNLAMFYVLRFLLGLGEAGFFPGVLFFLSTWFPAEHRARITGLFMMFGALANAVGAPIAGLLLDLDGLGGLRGWQWVFLCTGAPAVLLAAVTLRILPDRPADARFLTAIEAARLADLAAGGPQAPAEGGHAGALRILGNRRVIGLSLFYMLYPLASFGLSYWMPTILKAFGFGNTANGFLNMAPWLLVAVALWWWPRHADRTGERRWHIVLPAALAAACLLGSAVLPGIGVKYVCLTLAAVGIFAGTPVFWSLPATRFRGSHAAAAIAMISSVGNLGGFLAQYAVPAIRDATGDLLAPMLLLAVAMAAAALLALLAVPDAWREVRGRHVAKSASRRLG